MKRSAFQRIVGLNLAILVVLSAVLRLVNRGSDGTFAYMLGMAVLILFMMLLNAGLALGRNTSKEYQQAHWLSCLLVLLIGFGLCGAGASSYDAGSG